MFDISQYPYDAKHHALEVAGEAMIFHCHHYINYLQRSILDAEYIDSARFMVGAAADSVKNQLSHLCLDLSLVDSIAMAESMYQTFGYGLIDLSELSPDGGIFKTSKSFFSKTWQMKFGTANQPVDYYTRGYLAAVYSTFYEIPLNEIQVTQSHCMACGDEFNQFEIGRGKGNFDIYPAKRPSRFIESTAPTIGWEHEATITNAFLGAHQMFVGNAEGLIPAFGVYLVRNQSDYVNRLQFEFMRKMKEVVGDYGEVLASELLLEAGHACGFFTYAGLMTSNEWQHAVQPYLKTREDWIYGLLSVINTMGWGYHTVIELSETRAVFRNYNDFEDLSYQRMYGTSDYPVHWANSGGFTGLMQLVYQTDLVSGHPINSEEGFRQMRRAKAKYKTHMKKSIACGDDYLEVEITL
ncbi:4-vinyl reductase [Thiomicrorhabdus indica]|uniref:4-vinyl reductase n=1 Tax=Thiomicrorhabdus indica TaxID=2267253 RepID=UPI002AA7A665|nr:4-vinyl reductase [Thiomicrorhabdus indica]